MSTRVDLQEKVLGLILELIEPGLDMTSADDRAVTAVLITLNHAISGGTSLEELAMCCISFDRGELEIGPPPPEEVVP